MYCDLNKSCYTKPTLYLIATFAATEKILLLIKFNSQLFNGI